MISIFYPTHGILEITVDKEASNEEFTKLTEHLSQNQSLPRCLSILFLAPEGFRDVVEDDLSAFAESLELLTQKYEKINIAFTVSAKKGMDLVERFNEKYQIPNFEVYPCQCIKEAKRKLRRLSLSIERLTYNYAV